MTADQMSRPQGHGDIPVVPGVVLGMSTIRARITAATLAVTAALTLSACGAVGLLQQGDAPVRPTTTTPSAPSTTRTPAAVPTLPTREPAPATEHIAEPTDPLRADVETIAADALAFWQSMTGRTIPADARAYDGPAKCAGNEDTLALVCRQSDGSQELRWSRPGMTKAQREGTDVALALTLSHEVGHVVLNGTGNSTNNALEERRADCMAGVYLSVSKLDLGMTPSILWDKAFPATRGPNASNASEAARKDAIKLGFNAQDDPLAFCLANA